MTFQTQIHNENRIEIYQFTVYDVISDQAIKSKRWGTESAIAENRGSILRESKALVDPSATLSSDVSGLTTIGYMPPVPQE